jgi:5-methylcytosine-specific restriction protein A
MPSKPRHPCAYRGCAALTDKRYCIVHEKADRKAYDQKRKQDEGGRRFIDTMQWRKIRQMKLNSDPLCERCLLKGMTVGAVIVHHKDHNQGNNEPENHESLCVGCHEAIHGKDRFKRRA